MFEHSWIPISKIFKDESKLQVDYVPRDLPHREEQLKKLWEYFRPVFMNPCSLFVRVILLGKVGTGKTAVVRRFGRDVDGLKIREGFTVKFSYVNCHTHRTLFSVLYKVGHDLGLTLPRRGFSSEELMNLAWSHLKSSSEYLVLVLDEADYLVRSAEERVLYSLTRISEIVGDELHRIGVVFVFRDLTVLIGIEPSIQSTLQHNIIRFPPYTAGQIIDILWGRVREGALYDSAVNDEVMEMIGDLVGSDKGGTGDARLALELLYRAGKYAEEEGRDVIIPEDVRNAYSDVMPLPRDTLKNLRTGEKLLLLALIRLLQRKKFVDKVPMGLLEMEYNEVCDELGAEPRKHTTIWEYVRNLEAMGIITTEKPTKGFRGRTTLVGLPTVSLSALEREIIRLIREDLGR